MSERPYLLFVNDGAWRVGAAQASSPLTTAPEATLEARAAAVKEHAGALGDAGPSVVLALPSAWCLAATVSTEGLDRSSRRRAMGFRIEEHLPIAAEDVVADYVMADDGQALGVCAEFAKIEAIVAALEAAGVRVRHICPAVLLAAACAADEQPKVDAVLVGSGGEASEAGYDFVELRKAKPSRWWWLAQDAAAIRERVSAWAGPGEARRLAMIGCDEALRNALAACGPIEWVDMRITRDEAATRHVGKSGTTGQSLWVDLRSGRLAPPDRWEEYRKPLAALAGAVVMLLACLAGVMLWRGQQYSVRAREYGQKQVSLFKAAMPNQPVPGSIKGRLESERRKLVALGGQAAEGGASGAVQPVSALVRLRDVLQALPAQGRYRILDVNIQPDLIRLEGQVPNHADADTVAAGLRQSGGYDVEPPKTQAMKERGVGFAFTAMPKADGVLPKAGAP